MLPGERAATGAHAHVARRHRSRGPAPRTPSMASHRRPALNARICRTSRGLATRSTPETQALIGLCRPTCFPDTACMQLPRLLVRLIDPATAYMQGRSPRRSGPIFRGGAVFGPGVEGGARQATPEELEHMRTEAEDSHLEARTRRGPDIDPAMTGAAGNQLIEQGRTTIHVGERELSAHIITFCHGDSLLEIDVHARDMSSSSRVRVPRRLSVQHLPMLTEYLTDALQAG